MAAHGAQDSQQAAPSPAESPVPLLQIAQLLLKTRAFCWAWRRSDLLEAVPKMANIQPAAKAPLELKPPEKVTCKDGGEPAEGEAAVDEKADLKVRRGCRRVGKSTQTWILGPTCNRF